MKYWRCLPLLAGALSAPWAVASPSFFACQGTVYDRGIDRIRSFSIGFQPTKTPGVERALVFFDERNDGYLSANRPYGLGECRGDATGAASCTVATDDTNNALPRKLVFSRDASGNLKFDGESNLTGVTPSGKCKAPTASRYFDILDVSFVGTAADPAEYGTKVTIRMKTEGDIVECGGEIQGFHQGQRRHYRGWLSEHGGGTCKIADGATPGTRVLWMTPKAGTPKVEAGTYYLDRVWVYRKNDRWPSNEAAWGFDGFVVK